MRQSSLLSVACLVALLASATSAAESRVGRAIDNFTLRDYLGTEHTLDELGGDGPTVVAFLGTECPLAKLYAPRLVELADEFESRGVTFVGINSNVQDSVTEMASYARRAGIEFPILKDVGNVVADQFGAIRTPEIFVLDADRVVRYWGRVDDQYGFQKGVGYQRPEPERRDLAEALNELLDGKEVSVPQTSAPGCHIGRVRQVSVDSEVTYSNQIARVFQKYCVECHREGEIAPFPLRTYDDVVGWGEMIREVVEEQRMPPWHANPAHGSFANDVRMSDDDKQLVYDWVAAGCPEGDPADLPEPRQFAQGWQIGEPDMVVQMADEAMEVPATGVIDYKHLVVDPGFTEDMWVQAAECRPGNRAVVHHIIVFVKPPNDRSLGHGGLSGFLAATAPGAKPMVAPPGMAKLVPAGSKFVFQMHYTPNGTATTDLSSIGLKFVPASSVEHQLSTSTAANPFFRIPAGDPNYEVKAYKTFRRDTLLVSLYPHMHLRGKSFRYTAVYPDGTEEILLDVPRYDFNWQNTYELAEPKVMPRGSRLIAEATFDNSEDNLANPDPTAEVTFGEQTFDEMMIGFFDAADLSSPDDESKDSAEVANRRNRNAK